MKPFEINLLKNTNYKIAKKTSIVGGKRLAQDASLRKGKIYSLGHPATLEGLGSCVGLTLWSPQGKFVAHSAPEFDLPQFISKPIEKIIYNLRQNLKHSYDEIVAFINGGIHTNKNDEYAKRSSDLVEAYYNEIIKNDIPVTVIARQFGDGKNSRINSYLTASNAIVTGKPIDMIMANEKSSQEELQSALEDVFDLVEISPKVPVRIFESMPKTFK